MNYYTDISPKCCLCLEALVRDGLIPPGIVHQADVRDLTQVRGTQAHFFAGIGGWSIALDLIGWPRDVPVWTASLPCQPFSTAGRQRGFKDDRHLWPAFRNLVEIHRPAVLFGEQTQSELGRAWLSHVQADMEALGYATAAADLCGACVGSPQRRQRLYWVAHAQGRWKRKDRETLQRSLGGCRDLGAPWAEFDVRTDRYGTRRPVEPGLECLADGLHPRVSRVLRESFGNSIIPQVAALFIRSAIDVILE